MAASPIFRNARISDNFTKLHSYIALRSRYLQDDRTRFELIDREVERENDRNDEQRVLIRLNAMGDKRKLRDMTVPVVQPAYETALAYMESVFLSGYPIFSVVANRANETAASAIHGLMGRDQQYYGWERQFRISFADGLRYNFMGVETLWDESVSSRIITENTPGAPNTGKVEEVAYEGNCIKRLDPYNSFYDRSVAPGDVATEGDYAGYIGRKTYAQLKSYIAGLDNEYKNTAKLSDVFATPANQGQPVMNSAPTELLTYYTPKIRAESGGGDPADFSSFFNDSKGSESRIGGMYDHVVAYVRLIPRDFGIIAPSRAGSVHIYRVEWVNGICIYVKPIADAHGRFPITFAQPMEDGMGTDKKSFCENLIEYQDIATALSRARFKSLRRSLNDRALFDAQRIKEEHINSENPAAKIPVRMNALQRDVASAFHHIPYRDEMGATHNQELGQTLGLADRASGINQAMSGNFVKGNKTFQEFDRVMSGGESKLELRAKMIESQLMVQVKYILRSNYLQYAVGGKVFDRSSKKEVEVDPVEMRKQEVYFTVTDGVLPASKVMNPEVVNAAVTGLTQLSAQTGIPITHDVMGMMVSVLKSAGFTNLDDYKLEQQNVPTPPGAAAGPSAATNATPAAGA